MPRNGSGSYTLPQAAFVPGTTISSSAVNSDFSDIATALTDSIAADGQTPITGALKQDSGTLAAPSWTFVADTSAGLYLAAAGKIGLAAGNFGVLVDSAGSTVATAPVASGGSGYAVGDTITLTGGGALRNAILTVASLSGSAVASATVTDGGLYSSQPSNPVAQGSSSGSGTSATFNVTWSTTDLISDQSGNALWQVLGATSYMAGAMASKDATALINYIGLTAIIGGGSNAGYGFIKNATIVESNTSNAVTFTLKTLAGNTPSAADPVLAAFRNSTGATGNYVFASIQSAVSLTISAGSTLGTGTPPSAAPPFHIWLVLFNDAGTIRLGAINCLSGTDIYPLGRLPLVSSTAEGGVGGADSSQVFYTGTAVSSKAYLILGYAEYASGLSTAGNWNVDPTYIQLYGAGVPLPGDRIQFLTYLDAGGQTSTTSATYVATNTAVSITPTSLANVIMVEASGTTYHSSSYAGAYQIGRNSSSNMIGNIAINNPSVVNCPSLFAAELAPSTSSTTYTVYYKTANSTTTYWNYLSTYQSTAYINAWEVMA
jgi:hypothetical protein